MKNTIYLSFSDFNFTCYLVDLGFYIRTLWFSINLTLLNCLIGRKRAWWVLKRIGAIWSAFVYNFQFVLHLIATYYNQNSISSTHKLLPIHSSSLYP